MQQEHLDDEYPEVAAVTILSRNGETVAAEPLHREAQAIHLARLRDLPIFDDLIALLH